MTIELEAFLAKLEETESGCWVFTGSQNSEGYGNIWVDNQCKKAHRVSFELHKGPIPEGLLVCHTCDNPPCCHPEHLFIGTDADNTADKVAKGRMSPTFGANNPSAWLLEKDIREIHVLLLGGTLTQEEIGKLYSVSKGHINNIKYGRSWPHIYNEINSNA